MGLFLRAGFYFILIFFFTEFSTIVAQIPDTTFRYSEMNDSLVNDSSGLYPTLVAALIPDSVTADTLLFVRLSDESIVLNDSLIVDSLRPKLKSTAKPPDTVRYWRNGGCLTFNISQVSLSDWSAGGQNSIAANALLNLTASYSRKNAAWDNTFDFGFGRLKRENSKAVKTDDKIEFSTKYGRRFAKKWFYSSMINFKTQAFPGYDFPEKDSVKISDILSPATVFLSIGIDFKPNDKFSFLLSTVTGKTTIVKSNLLSGREFFGVDSGKHFRHEFGGYMKLLKKGSFLKFMNYQLKLDAFSNYMEKPGNVDWDCEFMLWARFNKYITANFKLNLLYDDDVNTPPKTGPRLQRRQFLGIGFSYRL